MNYIKRWCSNLDDHDYFILANNYAIFIKDNIINVIGHIDLEDLNNIESSIINKLKRNDDKQKIIISSDGVTDLICEERFKTYFTNDIDSEQIIKDALSKKDTKHLNKKKIIYQ